MFKIIPIRLHKTSFTLLKKGSKVSSLVNRILADEAEYVHDPEHKKNPGPQYHKTDEGWSTAEQTGNKPALVPAKPKSQVTLSPEVNVPVKDEEYTKHNEKYLSGIVSNALEFIFKDKGNKPIDFKISRKNSGRYYEGGVLYEEGSYSIDLDGIDADEATEVGKHLASVMSQDSVLVWDDKIKRGKIIYNPKTSKKNITFDDGSSTFFLDSDKDQTETIKKIDDAMKSALADRDLPSGWTIEQKDENHVKKINGNPYFAATNSLVVHGMPTEYVMKIAESLKKAFGMPVLVVDMTDKSEKIV